MNGKIVKEKRQKAGLSQWAVAKPLGKTQAWLSLIENEYVDLDDDMLRSIVGTIVTLAAVQEIQSEGR